MKRILALLLIFCLAFCLVACKNEGNKDSTSSDLQSETVDVTSSTISDVSSDAESKTESKTESEKVNSTTSSTPESNKTSTTTSTSQPTHTHSYSNATCTEAAKCSCGATNGAALGHKFVNKRCSVCKTTESGYKVVDSSDKTFSIILPEALANKCTVAAYSEWDGVQISVKDASLGMYTENVPVFVFTSVHSSVTTYEDDWKKKGDSLVFDQSTFNSLEGMGFKLKKTSYSKNGFTIYCQYIDKRDQVTGNSAVVKELLDNESKIEIVFN